MSAPRNPARPGVLLVHGLGRTRLSMLPLARAARAQGLVPHLVGYPSRHDTIARHAASLAEQMHSLAETSPAPLAIVAHSMGGIVLRAALAGHPSMPRPAAVVMLAPPNAGSEIVDRLRDWPPFRALMGPAALELGTDAGSTPRRLGPWPADIPLAIITGDRGGALVFGRWLPRPHDGKVSVASAFALAGARQTLAVRRAHSFVMWAPEVREAVFAFLQEHVPDIGTHR